MYTVKPAVVIITVSLYKDHLFTENTFSKFLCFIYIHVLTKKTSFDFLVTIGGLYTKASLFITKMCFTLYLVRKREHLLNFLKMKICFSFISFHIDA